MFRILVMNGLLISLILLWTSAAKEASKENLIKSTDKLPTEPLKIIPNILKWTSAAKEASKENLIKSMDKLPTEPLKINPNILNWTSAAKAGSKEHMIKSTDKLPTEPLKINPNIPIWTSAAKESATENMIKSTEKLPTEHLKRTQNIPIWTSAAKESSTENMIKSTGKLPTESLKRDLNEPNKEMLSRKFSCGTELGGVCVYHKKSCPKSFPLDTPQGKPYCLKKHRCCYTDQTTAAPTTIVPTTIKSKDASWGATINACIRGNNYKVYKQVTIDTCKEKCVEEEVINCQSIEYSPTEQICSISEARSNSSDYVEPCTANGWVFAEIELNTGSTTDGPTSMAPNNSSNNGSTTDGSATMAPNNSTTNGSTTDGPTTMAPGNITTNDVSCNLVWTYEEDHPLIMIRETRVIVPPVDKNISDDPNRIPLAKKLVFACPGENNMFSNIEGKHTKLHGECILHDKMKVCVNGYPEIMDLGKLSCSSQIHPSIIKQDNDTSFKNVCEDIGGNLYKMGYIYGDYREFKDLDTNICFREEDQTTLWTSTNINRNDISPKIRSKYPGKFRTAQGKEAPAVWNDTICHNYGGHCVRGGTPCPEHLSHQTSPGKPFCNTFHRCCYLEQCNPTTCTYKGQKGQCSIDALPSTNGVGSQECKKGCQCYVKEKKNLRPIKSLPVRTEFSKLLRGKCGGGVAVKCTGFWKTSESKSCSDLWAVPTGLLGPKGQCCQPLNECAPKLDPPGLWIPSDILGNLTCSDLGAIVTKTSATGGLCCRPPAQGSTCIQPPKQSSRAFTKDSVKMSLQWIFKYSCVWKRQECNLGLNNQGDRPIVLKEVKGYLYGSKYDIVLPIKTPNGPPTLSTSISHGTRLIFTCPGRGQTATATNRFIHQDFEYIGPTLTQQPRQALTADCINGNLFVNKQKYEYVWKQDMADMGCVRKPKAIIHTRNERCGHANVGNLHYIAFEAYTRKYYNMITTCFMVNQQTTLWAKHIIHGESMSAQGKVNRPGWDKTTLGPFTFNIDEAYKGQRQENLFNGPGAPYTNFATVINSTTQAFFSRGHLASKTDFVTEAEQRATFIFTNVLPQWQTYNNENWALIEQKVQKLAEDNNALLEIYTGGSDIMKTTPNTGVNIYLGRGLTTSGNTKVPIPNLFWKVVVSNHGGIKKAVAFVGNNNPNVPVPVHPCQGNDVCGRLAWFTATEKNKLRLDARGSVYCCRVRHLTAIDFRHIPDKNVIGNYLLLTNI